MNLMNQTFYIEPEEEISSVIDRLNKSTQVDNYFVVPKRAMFLQSVVNLKLLKREADKVGKHVVIVTQDELGASMAVRCELEVRSALEETAHEQVMVAEKVEDVVEYEIPEDTFRSQQEKQVRLSGVGTDNFYDSNASHRSEILHPAAVAASEQLIAPNNNSIAVEQRRSLPLRHDVSREPLKPQIQSKIPTQQRPQLIDSSVYNKKLNSEKETALEKIYSPTEKHFKEKEVDMSDKNGKMKKVFFSFLVLCLVALIGVVAYLFLPSAKIIIQPNISKNKVDLDLVADSSITKADKLKIPLRIIDKEESLTLSYDVVGGKTVAGKKARGSIVIYNAYDASPQTLIATTRFESADGKIFRLVKNVIVPGATNIAGETKPGVITAEVIADQSGAEYNIGETDFSIPGFKDSPKYAKFYAKSKDGMAGGSVDGETAGGAVKQSDIDNAKQKTEAALNEKIRQVIKDELKTNEIGLEQAEKIVITKSSSGVRVGDLAGSISYTASALVRALVFSEDDVKKSLEESLLDNSKTTGDVKKNISKIEYGTVDADFDKNFVELKIYGEVTSISNIDEEKIKTELLGKNEKQLADVLRKYPMLGNINIEFKPTFISRIPQYSQRVTLEIVNNGN